MLDVFLSGGELWGVQPELRGVLYVYLGRLFWSNIYPTIFSISERILSARGNCKYEILLTLILWYKAFWLVVTIFSCDRGSERLEKYVRE